MDQPTVRVKVRYGAEIRRLCLARESLSFERLQAQVARLFAIGSDDVVQFTRFRDPGAAPFSAEDFKECVDKGVAQVALRVVLAPKQHRSLKNSGDDAAPGRVDVKEKAVRAHSGHPCHLLSLEPGPKSTLLKSGHLPPVHRGDDDDEKKPRWKQRRSRGPRAKIPDSLALKYKRKTTQNSPSISVDGKLVEIPDHTPPDTLLIDFLRSNGFTAPKIGCQEGGCGCCTVVLSYVDPATSKIVHHSANSCMRLLYSCDGMTITTANGVGNKRDGYHPIQVSMSDEAGTQCGYCTPGWVSQMYSLLLNDAAPSVQDIEDNFSGNLCRCTGYRPILTAFRAFAADGTKSDAARFQAEAEKILPADAVQRSRSLPPLIQKDDAIAFVRPCNLADLGVILEENADTPTRIAVGNTSRGVNKYFPFVASDEPVLYIDVGRLQELKRVDVGANGVRFGSALRIAEVQRLFEANNDTETFDAIAKHLKLISQQVRNCGSWAGNIMLGVTHPDFPSDLLTIFTAANARLVIAATSGEYETQLEEFAAPTGGLPPGAFIREMFVPRNADTRFQTFKITSRAQNSHPIVNAAFSFFVDDSGDALRIVDSRITYGGLQASVFLPQQTLQFLRNVPLTKETLATALQTLSGEVHPADNSPVHSVEYRKSLALSLFYKAFIRLVPNLDARLASAADQYRREISSGSQTYSSPGDSSPIGDPVDHISARWQTAGEALYTSDEPFGTSGLYAAPITSTVAKATILSIDVSAALSYSSPNVVDVVLAGDVEAIGGNNNIPNFGSIDELFVSREVKHYGQIIGMVVATTQAIAEQAAKRVFVQYGVPVEPAHFTIEDAIEHGAIGAPATVSRGDLDAGFAMADHILEGEVSHDAQFSCPMETQVASATPDENDSIRVQCATQGPNDTQRTIMTATGLPGHRVAVSCKRSGGAFGVKVVPAYRHAAMVAVCARKLNRPVRSQLERVTHMHYVHRRHPHMSKYRVGYTNDGKIVALDLNSYADGGITGRYGIAFNSSIDNVYFVPHFRSTVTGCATNLPSNAPVRAPDTPNAIMFMENVINRVAQHSGIDQALIRETNFYGDNDTTPSGSTMPDSTLEEVWSELKTKSNFEQLQTETENFNAANRWRKRGIAIVPIKFGQSLSYRRCEVHIAVNSADGSVLATTNGAEMGQGLFTRVAQAIAFGLGIPMSLIHVQETTTRVTPNGQGTFASSMTESCVQAALDACEKMREKLEPYQPAASWQALVLAASDAVSLTETGFFAGSFTDPKQTYYVWAAGVCVAEVDLLTGERDLLRADVVYDAGKPLNPKVDLGQIEGSFVMGIGLALVEELRNNADGSLRTPGLWEYKPSCSKTIPVEMNIGFLDVAANTLVKSSKSTGEPAVDLAASAWLAVKNALQAGREELNLPEDFRVNAPLTVERSALAVMAPIAELTF